ncbi:MAG TPA: hypothetical protein VNL98_02080 [Gemmatimonadales bacterium]|nr:hypothetical protein [Gemmatimonadales bacterium]
MRPPLFLAAGLLAAAACREASGPELRRFLSVAAGDGFTCAIASGGEAWCWGDGTFGQLGNGTTGVSAIPVRVAGGHSFAAIAAGNTHACALTADGVAWCWGLNDFRELGTRTVNCNNNLQFLSCAASPVRVDSAPPFTRIAAAGYYTCAIAATGAAWCWGWSNYGQVGTGVTDEVVATPSRVLGGLAYRSIELDAFHACGITTTNAVYCWGSNRSGELGAETGDPCTPAIGAAIPCSPVPVASAPGFVGSEIALGSSHSCLLTGSGVPYCWGSNSHGALGSPGASGGPVPVPVDGDRLYRTVVAGRDHNCAIDYSDRTWCWGSNLYGESGPVAAATCPGSEGPVTCAPAPVALSGSPTFVQLSAGASHTCALTSDGAIYCWGRGTEGQLGDGNRTSTATPVRVTLVGASPPR